MPVSVIIAIRIMPYTIPTNSQLKICEGMLVNCFNFLPHCHGEIDQIFKMLPTSSVVLHDIIAKVLSALIVALLFSCCILVKSHLQARHYHVSASNCLYLLQRRELLLFQELIKIYKQGSASMI